MSETAPTPPQEGLFIEELSSEQANVPEIAVVDTALAEATKLAIKAVCNARRGNDAITAGNNELSPYRYHR